MELRFDVGGEPAVFRRDGFSGRADLSIGGEPHELASPGQLGTHFSTGLRRTWRVEAGGHVVEIEKIRPFLAAAFRPHRFIVRVDGQVVADEVGR